MSAKARIPLMAKMLIWLLVHFGVLALAFVAFVNWQFEKGLDSLLSGAATERLSTLGDAVASDLRSAPESDWPSIIDRQIKPYGVEAMLRLDTGEILVGEAMVLPEDIESRLRGFRRPVAPRGREGGEAPPERRGAASDRGPGLPPGEGRPGGRPSGPPPWKGGRGEGGMGPPPGDPRPGPGGDKRPGPMMESGPPEGAEDSPSVKTVFLTRATNGDGYWAAIDLRLFEVNVEKPRHGMLLLRSEDASAGGLFFDLRPWLLGGLAVLGLSLLLWAPFVIDITRYVSRLSNTTERIAEGQFDARVGATRHDELGVLGHSIEGMAERLDGLVRGQKRFLGDVAHELCSPLARVRTGLGILEHGIEEKDRARLASIEEDAAELSSLVSEVLAFTKASTAPDAAKLEPVEIRQVVLQAIERECPGHSVDVVIPRGLKVTADKRLLSRALANLMRNADRHGGADCHITVSAKLRGEQVDLMLKDDGPGVAEAELANLFEPFYRPDSARTRESGGSGLGLAIVRSGIEACGGKVSARAGSPRGLVIQVTLDAA